MLQRNLQRILMLVSLALLGSASGSGQTIPVSIPDTTARKGDTLLIPIRIVNLTVSDSVYSGEFLLSYDAAVIDIFDIDVVGTFSSSLGSVLFNNTTRRLAFVSAGPEVAGNGVFVYLKTRALLNPPRDTTTIYFSSAVFNEGSPGISFTPGKFRALRLTVSPKTPSSTVVVGDSVQFSVSGDQLPPLTWTSSDPLIGTVDATGEFKALAVGQAKVYVEDSRGLKDSTALFAVYPPSAASLTISAHDTSHTQTLEFNLPVYTTDVTGLGIISSEFTMNFSSSRLQAIGVLQIGSMTEGWSAPAFNISSGQIDVVLAGTEELVGSGILVYVRMRVLPAASGGSTVSFANVLFNENLTANTVSATFTPITAPTVVVTPASVQMVRDDTLSFFVTSGGTPPYVWASSNPTVASINPSTGLLTANVRGTTTVSVTDSYGFVGTTGTITVTDVQVSVADTAVWPLDSVDVPIFVDDMTGLEIYSYEMRIVYDSSVVKILSVVTDGTLSSSFTVFAKDTLDTLRIAVAGMSPLSGSGILLKVRFKSNSLPPSVGPLTIAKCQFNEPGAGTPTAKTQNGSISVVDATVAPLLDSPADGATGVEVDPALAWNSSLGASFYHVQLSLDPAFGSFVENVTGIGDTSFTPSVLLMLDTVYYWRVRAGNSGGTTLFSAEWSFRTVLITSVTQVGSGIPDAFELAQNFPNPFNPSTTIRFGLPSESYVLLIVYDMVGNQIGTAFSGVRQAGTHQVSFDSANLSSGVYFYQLKAVPAGGNLPSFQRTMKMVLMK